MPKSDVLRPGDTDEAKRIRKHTIFAVAVIPATCFFLFLYFLPLYIIIPTAIALGIGTYLLRGVAREMWESCTRRPDTGETIYGFAGYELRTFSDSQGVIWIRANDLRAMLDLKRSDMWMAKAYPEGFRKSHPTVSAYFIRSDIVLRHWKGSTNDATNRCLSWIERELIPLQSRSHPVATASSADASQGAIHEGINDRPSYKGAFGYILAHWHGKLSLAKATIGSGVVAFFTCVLWAMLGKLALPEHYIDHYRFCSFWDACTFLGAFALTVWWGMGVWRSARAWLDAERSLLVGVIFVAAGLMTCLYALDWLASRDGHFGFMTSLVIAADLDGKAHVVLSDDGTRIRMNGEMGMGTTEQVRLSLDRHPGIKTIELDSPGGRAMEGFALADLIVSRGLNTSVRAGCASACVLAFAAGKERLATRSSRFGLHRSGVTWRRNGGALSPTDLAMKDFFTSRGIAADFIARALEQPLEKIWEPSFSEILGSQLATGEWLPLPQ